MDDVTRLSRCVRCGAAVEQPDSDLCPACIRELADAPTVLSDPATRLADQATHLLQRLRVRCADRHRPVRLIQRAGISNDPGHFRFRHGVRIR